MMESRKGSVVLCGANSYEQKYYLNDRFASLPQHVRDELKVICVTYVEDVGGILTMEFAPDGTLTLNVQNDERDYLFDEIGSVLKIRQIQRERQELLEMMETYYRALQTLKKRGGEHT